MTPSISTHTTRVTPLAHTFETSLYHLFQPHEVIDTMLQNIRGICSHPVIENLAKKIILIPKKNIENKIKRLREPDPSLIDQIKVHEETPGVLWCTLLERSHNVPKLRKWLLESIQIEWLSLPNYVGRACRDLLQNAFDESILQKWLQTEPEPRILIKFFEGRTIKSRKLSAKTLVHLKMLSIEFFASQSLTVFPWERMKGRLEDKNAKWLILLQSNMPTLTTIPDGLKDLCRKTQTIRGIEHLLEIIGGNVQESFLLEANGLMQKLCNKSKHVWTLENYLPSHFKAILDLKNPPADLLQGAVHLLLQPVCKYVGNPREALFEQFMQRIIELLPNLERLKDSAKLLHEDLMQAAQPLNLHLQGPVVTAFKVPAICRISASAIIQHAQSIMEHYLAIDPQFPLAQLQLKWNHLLQELPTLQIDFPFQENEGLSFFKIFLRRICTTKFPEPALHWVFSLFALSYVHQFAVHYPLEAAFAAEMISEIFFNGHFSNKADHAIIAKAFFNFESERMIKIPDFSNIKMIFTCQLDALKPAGLALIPKLIERLIQNGCIGALNEINGLLEVFGNRMMPLEKETAEHSLDELLSQHLDALLDTPEHFADFIDRFPRLVLRCTDRLMNTEGANRANALKGLLIFLTEDARSLLDSPGKEPLDNFKRLRKSLRELVKQPALNEIKNELNVAVCVYVDQLVVLLEKFFQVYISSKLTPFCEKLIKEATKALTTIKLHELSPLNYRILWQKLLLLHLRKLLQEEKPNLRPILDFYSITHPAAFSEDDHAQISLYAGYLRKVTDVLPKEVIDAHEAFFVRAGYYAPEHFGEIISSLMEPDDRLFEGICALEPVPAQHSLMLFKHVQASKKPPLDAWILQKVPSDWLLRNDAIGTTLRSILKRAPQEEFVTRLNGLFKTQAAILQTAHLLELLPPERIYPIGILESLRDVLKRVEPTASQKESFITLFLNQDLQYFPWEWIIHKNHLHRIAQQLLKADYAPASLQHHLQSDSRLSDGLMPLLVRSPHPQHLPLFERWISRTLDNKKIKPDYVYLEKHIHVLLSAASFDWIHLQQAASLLLHPRMQHMPHLKERFEQFIDCTFRQLFENSPDFEEKATLFKELCDEFPCSRYGEDPVLTKGFTVQPGSRLSLKSMYQSANRLLLHYLSIVLFFDTEKAEQMQSKLRVIEEEISDAGVTLNFDPEVHDQLHWMLIEKLIHYPVKSSGQKALTAFFAKVHLHQYALNHRKDTQKLLAANERIFFLSAFDNQGTYWLEQFTYSMFADEKRIQPNDRMLRSFHLNLIEANVESLRMQEVAHTKYLHDLFMGLIRTGTPAALEVAERVRSELTFEIFEPYWGEESAETIKAFHARIMPLLEHTEDLGDFFHPQNRCQSKPYLLKLTFLRLSKQPDAFSPALQAKLLAMVATPKRDSDLSESEFNLQQFNFLIDLWKINGALFDDAQFVSALLSGAEGLRQSIAETPGSFTPDQYLCTVTVLKDSPLHALSSTLYCKLWQTMHEYLFKKAAASPEEQHPGWINRLCRLIAIAHRDVILNAENSLSPYLEKTLEQMAKTPSWETYHQKLTHFLS